MQNEAMVFLDQTSIICCRPGKNSHQLVCVTSLQTNYCKDLQVARCTRLCESLVWVQTYLMNFSSKVQVAHTFFWHDCYLLFKLYCIINTHAWVSDCCSTPTQQFFSYTMARTSQFSMRRRWWWGPLCSRPTRWVGFL